VRYRRAGLAAVAVYALVASGCSGMETLSTAEALDRLSVATTKIYAADGSLIANLHGEINRDIVTLDRIPKHVQDAVISIEDQRFWVHAGVDVRAIGRAAVNNARGETSQIQGGSTISQQLVKNLYFASPDRTIERKLAEARKTIEFEQTYPKPRILEMYLNTIYLGRGAYGFQAAAKAYFQRPIEELGLGEAAFLAGAIHEPSRYDLTDATTPEEKESVLERAHHRRRIVLDRMVEMGAITPEDAEAAAAEPLDIKPIQPNRWEHPYFVDMVLRQLGVLGTRSDAALDGRYDALGATVRERARNVYQGGLRIHTTLDPRIQKAAEEAVQEVLPANLEKLSASVVSIEPETGHVRALVGGRGYYPDGCAEVVEEMSAQCRLAKVNLALGSAGGGSGRQPGSGFKPFVLAAALEEGIGLGSRFGASEFVHKLPAGEWKVRNYEGSGSGSVDLIEGTAKSVNAVYARLTVDGLGDGDAVAGAGKVAALARRLGIGFPTPEQMKERCGDRFNQDGGCTPADSVPAISLGAKEASPMEIASAYGVFAADGMRAEPTAIVRIEDAQGQVIYEADPERKRVLPSDVARAVTYALRQVIERGTATGASLGSRPAAGKTGTSQQWRDAWFTGYVPQLVTSVWVGNPILVENRNGRTEVESMVPANGYPRRITGGSYPAMIWHRLMSAALEDAPIERFPPPPSRFLSATRTPKPSERSEPGTTWDASEGQTGPPTPVPPAAAPAPGRTEPREPRSARSDGGGGSGTVPSVIGMSPASARSALSRAGYSAAAVRECPPGGSDSMNVWRQSPGGGSSAPRGSTVTIWHSPAVCR